MIEKSAVLARAGWLPAAAALALMGQVAAHAESSPPVAPQRAPESELGAMKAAAAEPAKDQAPASTAPGTQKPANAPATTPAAAAPTSTATTTPPQTQTTTPAATTPPAAPSTSTATTTPAPPQTPAPAPAAEAAKKDVSATTPTPPAVPGAPAATAALPDAAPGATPPGATPPAAVAPAPPADPIVAAIRQRISDSARGANPDDVKALTAYYGELIGPPQWVSASGLTPKGKVAADELAKAGDWGLTASDFQVPQVAGALTPEAAADAEVKMAVALLKYARYARGGRVNPMAISQLIDQTPPLRDPKVVLADLGATDNPDAYLRSLHPTHQQFELLRQALLKSRGGTLKEEAPAAAAEQPLDPALAIQIPSGRVIVPGGKDPQIALLRQRLKVPAADLASETVYDAKLQDAVREFQRGNGLRADAQIGNGTRNALNSAGKPKQAAAPPPPATNDSKIERILINMERWRWLPEQLGKLYVWDNVPEALTRIVKDGKVIHTDKIIVGQPTWPTPSFSADMKVVVFHPSWGVPEGIKAKELGPILRKSSGGGLFGIFGGGYSANAVLEAYQLRAYVNGHQVDGNSVDWSSVDMRSVSFQQPPGPKNPLGDVKFMFPNKHDVYMHDTPEHNLFANSFRALSHGCMRVQDPRHFAEIILGEDKGWSAEKTRSMFAAGSQEVPLDTHIPVHVTYMTARVTDDGKLEMYGDFYGLDGRVAAALGNKNAHFEQPAFPQQDDVVAASDDDSPLANTPGQRGKKKKQNAGPQSLADAISGIFSP